MSPADGGNLGKPTGFCFWKLENKASENSYQHLNSQLLHKGLTQKVHKRRLFKQASFLTHEGKRLLFEIINETFWAASFAGLSCSERCCFQIFLHWHKRSLPTSPPTPAHKTGKFHVLPQAQPSCQRCPEAPTQLGTSELLQQRTRRRELTSGQTGRETWGRGKAGEEGAGKARVLHSEQHSQHPTCLPSCSVLATCPLT